jgi:hypothetical protein
MTVDVDVWLRGNDFATTERFEADREPEAWTDDDVRAVLEGMLLVMHRLKFPEDPEGTAVQLRGLSWIVNPFEDGGVVIAIEIRLGAAIAGPFAIGKAALEGMITRVLAVHAGPAGTVH